MMCFMDMSFCEDACICAVKETDCGRKLTESDGNRAAALGLPIAWMSFKDTCTKFKGMPCLPLTK